MTDAMHRAVAQLLVGDSDVIRSIRELICELGPSNLPVLIQGPTGSGKELVARALHVTSGRSGAFVAFNVCAIAESMFEDALFGHVRGAFTGAITDRVGFLSEAHRGTVFLDEISGLALASQVKLLRALETREFRPVGSVVDRKSDFRLVSATNESLAHASDRGQFRRDLLYRLGGARIEMPALKERREDIAALALVFARSASSEPGRSIGNAAIDHLLAYDWPGNVRELRSTIECAVVLARDAEITVRDLERCMDTARNAERTVSGSRSDFVRRRLLDVLEQSEWDIDGAAAILGVHRATVYRRLGRIGGRPGGKQGREQDRSAEA